MKTRIIHTKIHFEDDWFNTLPIGYRYLYIYLFTNQHIGMTGIYELPDRVALLETGANPTEWQEAKQIFGKNKKAAFYEGWVCVANAQKYANYTGPKNAEAYKKEIRAIPGSIIDYFSDTLSIQYIYPIDTTINHKSEIRNNKSETIIDGLEQIKRKRTEIGI